eukprot:6197382-Pleurochrysis_carterae.AAC.3
MNQPHVCAPVLDYLLVHCAAPSLFRVALVAPAPSDSCGWAILDPARCRALASPVIGSTTRPLRGAVPHGRRNSFVYRTDAQNRLAP